MRSFLMGFLVCLLLSAPLPAQELVGPPAPQPKPRSLPIHAVALIQADAARLDPASLIFSRWFWVKSEEPEDFKALADALHKISRDAVRHRPIPVGPMLARIDLRWYAPGTQDLVDWFNTWELLQFDPSFSLLITDDTIKLLEEGFLANLPCPAVKHILVLRNGEWIRTNERVWKVYPFAEVPAAPVIRANGTHLAGSGIEKLQEACLSVCPVVELRYFISRALSTVNNIDKDVLNANDPKRKDNAYSLIYGGLYYDFAGIRKSVKEGRTDLDQLLADLGIPEGWDGVFLKFRSDGKVILYRSKVTGMARGVVFLPIRTVHPLNGQGVVFVTIDGEQKDIQPGKHAALNVLNNDGAAYEVLFIRSNGSMGMAIYGANRQLLTEADINVVTDNTIPAPNKPKLESGIGCIRCHGPHDLWQPLRNDTKLVLQTYKKLDVFGDIKDRDKPIPETLTEIAGKVQGDVETLLRDLRNQQARIALDVTGPWAEDNDKAQVNTAKLTSARIAQLFAEVRYDSVGPRRALTEVGGAAPEGKELDELKRLLAPDPAIAINGIIPEDGRLGGLLSGIEITPWDWDLAYNFALDRAMRNRVKLEKGKP